MKLNVLDINDVVARQLCCGCGACAGLAPDRIEMIDSLEHGRRPRYRNEDADPGPDPLPRSICPGTGLERERDLGPGVVRELAPGWGPVLELWEGHATDPAIRRAGSSGGAATAIALWCLEHGGMHGALHVRSRNDAPILNETVLSTSRAQLLAATGSRYAPASPCEGLHLVERAPGPCVVIGKPCDIAAAASAARLRPALASKIGVTIGFFCAGTPTTEATYELLKHIGVADPKDVISIRYRGDGWPGDTVVRFRTAAGERERRLSYDEAWGGILARRKQWRCHVCADHTGEFADLAVGDPWYRPIGAGEAGSSLVLVRTERGREILHQAIRAGSLSLVRAKPDVLPASQPELLKARGAAWGRLLACRLRGVAGPRYRGLPMFRWWWSLLSAGEKARSILGTVRRIRTRRLRSRIRVTALEGPAQDLERLIRGAEAEPSATRDNTLEGVHS